MKKKWKDYFPVGKRYIKLLMIMKLCLLFMMGCFLHATASVKAQDTKVSLNMEGVSLEQIITELQKKTDLVYFYNVDDVSNINNLNVNCKDCKIKLVLKNVLKNTGLYYELKNEVVVIRKLTISNNPQKVQQKSIKITGKVTDKNKNPLPGVSVVVKGTNLGVATDTKGEYSIEVPSNNKVTLVFSFMGMKTLERNVGKKTILNITLEDDVQAMEEVIVTGIFKRKEESFTGSAVTIKSEELERVGNSNIFQSLKNIDPSLNILSNMEFGSDPNRLPDMQLRGTSTFPASADVDFRNEYQDNPNMPLFILDGFEASVTTIFDLDMSRVNSVTILKDASAKAIYGAKAANGVIVIETKTPLSGDLRVTYKGSADITMPDLTSYNLCNALEKLEVERIAGDYRGNTLDKMFELTNLYNLRLKKSLEGDDTYWLSKPLQTGIGTKHALTVEMGDKKTKFIANVSYNNIIGVMKGSGRTNIAGSISVRYRHKNLLFTNTMSITSNESEDSPYGNFSDYARMNPYWDAYNEDGTLATYDEDSGESYVNPLKNAHLNTSLKSTYFEFVNNFYTEWTINNSLRAKVRLGITRKENKDHKFYPANHSKFDNYPDKDYFRKGSYDLTNGNTLNIHGDFNLNYSKNIGVHYIMANFGFNIGERTFNSVTNYAEGFPSDKMVDFAYAVQYAKDKIPTGRETTARDIGALAVFSYVYDDRFLSDFTIRANASSKFGANKRWGNFWSFGLGWNIHKENFMKSLGFVKRLKLRGSIGTTGSQNFPVYQAIPTYKLYSDNIYGGMLGAKVKALANEDLQWQQKLDMNLGVDATLGRLNVKFDYYEAYTTNLITSLTLPPSVGFNTVKENVGKIKNNGYEVSLSYKILQSKRGFLNVNFSTASNNNKIVSLSNAMKKYNNDQNKLAGQVGNGKPVLKYIAGGSMNSIWVVPSLGIDPATGREIYINHEGETTYFWDPLYQVDGGSSMPKFRGNAGINGEYRGFGFSVVTRFLTGGKIYNSTLVNKVENINTMYNVDKRVLEGRWTTPGQYADFIRLAPVRLPDGTYEENPKTKPTSRFLQDRSELDIAAVNIYYRFSRNWIKKAGFEQLKLSCNMNDVYKFSSIKIERGTMYPFARTVSFSLSATF